MKKLLAMLLVLTMLFSSVQLVLSEEEPVEELLDLVEVAEEATSEEVEEEEEFELIPAAEEAPVEDEPTEPEETVEVVVAEPVYYAALVNGVQLTVSEEAVVQIPAGAVVLVTGEDEEFAYVMFNTEEGVVTGEVALADVVALTEEETEAFLDEVAAYEAVVLFEDDLDCPLPQVECSFTRIAAEESVEDLVQAQAVSTVVSITDQPENFECELGDTAVFTVVAENAASYQWYYTKDEGVTWTKLTATSAKTDVYEVITTKGNYNGKSKYKCIVTGVNGDTVDSDIVQSIEPARVSILTQPVNFECELGDTAVFTVVAENAASYQWYYTKDEGATWIKLTATSAKTDVYEVITTNGNYNGKSKYKCVVTGVNGDTIDSDVVQSVKPYIPAAPAILQQPLDCEVEMGGTAVFTIVAENVDSYQWYYTKDEGATWTKLTATSAKTDTYEVITTKGNYNGKSKYKCVVTGLNGETIDSDIVQSVEPYVAAAPVILQQPLNYECEQGDTAIFSIVAENAASYQWYYTKDEGATWTKLTATSAKTDTYEVITTKGNYNGKSKYKCVVTGLNGETIDSDIVQSVEPARVSILTQPVNFECQLGDTAVFTVVAENAASYQWYYTKDDGATWIKLTATSAKTDVYEVITTNGNFNGKSKYKCVITGVNGDTVDSDIVYTVKAFSLPAPVWVSAEQSGLNSIVLVWEAVTGADSYIINYTIDGADATAVTTTDTTYTVEGATVGTYSFTIEAVQGDQVSPNVSEAREVTVTDEIVQGEFIFVVNDTQDGIIVKKYLGSSEEVTVPDVVMDLPVKKIGDEAFMNNTTLSHISLPDTIEVIGARAFKGCTSLSSMD